VRLRSGRAASPTRQRWLVGITVTQSQLWRSIFWHGYPDTPLNQSLAVSVLMAVHFWRIRKDGDEASPPPPSRRDRPILSPDFLATTGTRPVTLG